MRERQTETDRQINKEREEEKGKGSNGEICDRRMTTNRARERKSRSMEKKAAQENGEISVYLVRQY